MDIKTLVKLTSRAWSLQILALLESGVRGQAALLSSCGAGRTAFAQSLQHLIEIDMLERNPGHGHPLRPEFRLTARGKEAAKIAKQVFDSVTEDEEKALLRRAWTAPILAASYEPMRFTDLKAQLETITDRALSQSIKQLQAQEWIQRSVDPEEIPTRPLYQAINTGAKISEILAEL